MTKTHTLSAVGRAAARRDLQWLATLGLRSLEREWLLIFNNYVARPEAWARVLKEPKYRKLKSEYRKLKSDMRRAKKLVASLSPKKLAYSISVGICAQTEIDDLGDGESIFLSANSPIINLVQLAEHVIGGPSD